MKIQTQEQEKFLPAVIHVIWAGGSRYVPKEGIENLAKWAYLNPNFKIVLWVDDQIIPPGEKLKDYQELYVKQFTEEYLKLAKDEEVAIDVQSIIQVRSIREQGICDKKDDLVDYAIDRIDPNYGLSSDLLRYRILHKYGGVYVDLTDVTPGTQKLNFLKTIPYANFGKVNDQHKVYVDHLSQTQKPSESELKSFILSNRDFENNSEVENEHFLSQSKVGNDSFICTTGNPLMLMMVQETEKRLQCSSFTEKVMMAYGGFNIKDLTLDLSGPNMVKTVIYDSRTGSLKQNPKLTTTGYYKKCTGSSGSYVFALRTDQYQAVAPPEKVRNTRYWNVVPPELSRIKNIDDVMKKIVAVADYEVTHMGVLRLEDHINTLTQATSLLRIDPREIPGHYDSFLSLIKRLPLQKVEVAQCVSNNPLVLMFYEETKLSKRILLNTKDREALPLLLKVWEQSTSYGLFMGTTDYQTTELSRIQTTEIMMNLKRLEIVDIFQRLQRGIKFIEFIKGNIDAYPCYKELLETNIEFQKQYLNEITKKYFNILDAYSDAFLLSTVDTRSLCQVGRQLLKLAEVEMLPEKLKDMVKLYQADNINHALRLAAAGGNLDHVKYLVKYADINEQGGKSKRTALHWAAEKGHKEIMQVLSDHGANKDLKDKDNKTAEQLTSTSSAENKQ